MPAPRLNSDDDPCQAGARRAVMARLCCVIERSRRAGGAPSHGRRLFTRDEAIAVGALFVLAMREVGMPEVIASAEKLADGLDERLARDPTGAPHGNATEDALIEAAEQLSNRIVTQLERATGEMW
jgi:hypothetical protein